MAKSLKLSDGYLLHVLLFVIAAILVYHFVFCNKKDGFFDAKEDACRTLKENEKCSYYNLNDTIYTFGTCKKNGKKLQCSASKGGVRM
jgi:hypothetical protein